MQPVDPKHGNAGIFQCTRRRFRQHDTRAALHGTGDEFDAMSARAMQREERITRAHVTRIQGKSRYDNRPCGRRLSDALQ